MKSDDKIFPIQMAANLAATSYGGVCNSIESCGLEPSNVHTGAGRWDLKISLDDIKIIAGHRHLQDTSLEEFPIDVDTFRSLAHLRKGSIFSLI